MARPSTNWREIVITTLFNRSGARGYLVQPTEADADAILWAAGINGSQALFQHLDRDGKDLILRRIEEAIADHERSIFTMARAVENARALSCWQEAA